ncbi:hypothetical protein [Mycobacterium sp. Z3061]|uniref:hypothetical protein n=1 Tax=Mycobacterium sp. Z3061 TaxID=3073562 RepID=UPI002873AF63|nr:hypothetical protein [Mycobacterium sp. Z3061]
MPPLLAGAATAAEAGRAAGQDRRAVLRAVAEAGRTTGAADTTDATRTARDAGVGAVPTPPPPPMPPTPPMPP